MARYSIVFLFLALEILSFAIYVNNERYAKSVFFSSSNSVVAGLYSASNYFIDFFKLRPDNEALSEENAQLKNKILQLENKLMVYQDSTRSRTFFVDPEREYSFISAKIINNSTNKVQNFITLNRGSNDGITPDMGVVSSDGVVGIVRNVSPRFSEVISVLNPMITISSKIVRNEYTGPLAWDAEDYRYARLLDIPRHVELQEGDTIVTSGLTATFPEGIPVGIIEKFDIKDGDAFFNIKIRLSVNFRVASQVNVIKYDNYEEQTTLESGR